MKFKLRKLLEIPLFLLIFPGIGQSALISPISATGSQIFNNSADLLIDGIVPAEGTSFNAATNVFWVNNGPTFTIDLGGLFTIKDVLVSVDNNDRYDVEWSLNSVDWANLFTILPEYGEIPAAPGGMDTMSTDITNPAEYVPGLDFAMVDARYLRIYGLGGDYIYAVGEIQAFGSEVPIPATVWLFGTALLAFVGMSRRRRLV